MGQRLVKLNRWVAKLMLSSKREIMAVEKLVRDKQPYEYVEIERYN